MYVTYTDLIQIGIFIVALVGLMYEIFKDKRKQPPHLAHVTAARQGSKSLFGVSRLRFPFLYFQYSISMQVMQVAAVEILIKVCDLVLQPFRQCQVHLLQFYEEVH